MIKSNHNQKANAQNPYQGDTTRALCICSAGLLRSPSIAKFLSDKGYNTRACGTTDEYALIPLSEALLGWADEIHVVKEQSESVIKDLCKLYPESIQDLMPEVYIYDIPDNYGTFTPELMQKIEEEYIRMGISDD